jgi:hypothetical protein
MDEAQVQAAIDGHAARLGVRRAGYQPYVPDTVSRDAAYPYWRLQGDTLVYAARERGRELFRRETTSFDELLYWVCKDISWEVAGAYELAHRIRGEDSRRQMFGHWVALMAGLRPEWGERVGRYVADVLAEAPYRDEGR